MIVNRRVVNGATVSALAVGSVGPARPGPSRSPSKALAGQEDIQCTRHYEPVIKRRRPGDVRDGTHTPPCNYPSDFNAFKADQIVGYIV